MTQHNPSHSRQGDRRDNVGRDNRDRGDRPHNHRRPAGGGFRIGSQAFGSPAEAAKFALNEDALFLDAGRSVFCNLSAFRSNTISMLEMVGIATISADGSIESFELLNAAVALDKGHATFRAILDPQMLGTNEQFRAFTVYWSPAVRFCFNPRSLKNDGYSLCVPSENRQPLVNSPSQMFPNITVPARGRELSRVLSIIAQMQQAGLTGIVAGSGIEVALQKAMPLGVFTEIKQAAQADWRELAAGTNQSKAGQGIALTLAQPAQWGGNTLTLDIAKQVVTGTSPIPAPAGAENLERVTAVDYGIGKPLEVKAAAAVDNGPKYWAFDNGWAASRVVGEKEAIDLAVASGTIRFMPEDQSKPWAEAQAFGLVKAPAPPAPPAPPEPVAPAAPAPPPGMTMAGDGAQENLKPGIEPAPASTPKGQRRAAKKLKPIVAPAKAPEEKKDPMAALAGITPVDVAVGGNAEG